MCARSSVEAEYRAVAMGVMEFLWIKIVLGLQVDGIMRLYCDNKAAINLLNNLIFHDRTKHVEINSHFIKEEIDSKELILPYIKTHDQIIDIFTKGIFSNDFERDACKLGIFDMYA